MTIAIAAGLAWAAETQSVSTPAGDSFTVTAVIVPGTAGAEVYGNDAEMEDDTVIFSVGFGDDLQVDVNGTAFGGFDPVVQHTVTVSCRRVGGVWIADTTVVNDQTTQIVAQQVGYVMLDRPDEAVATAADVVSLEAE